MLEEVDYATAFKALQESSTTDAMDAYYDYLWDIAILEFLTCILDFNKVVKLSALSNILI